MFSNGISRESRPWIALGVLLALVALAVYAPPAHGQNRGQYIPGAGGLNAGVQAPPGFTTGTFYVRYDADAFKDASGQSVPVDGRFQFDAGEFFAAYTAPWTFHSTTYGAAVAMFYMRGDVSLERFDKSGGDIGFGDMYIEPINLGWRGPRASVKVAYGFMAPTGQTGVTTDYWGHDFTAAGTLYFGREKANQISVNSVTEFHEQQEHMDLTVGNNTTLELGVGRLIPMNMGRQLLQLGVVGYAEWQLSDDTGTDALPSVAGQRDRVFAAGPEVGVLIPTLKITMLVRVEQEFSPRTRAEGYTVYTGIAKSF